MITMMDHRKSVTCLGSCSYSIPESGLELLSLGSSWVPVADPHAPIASGAYSEPAAVTEFSGRIVFGHLHLLGILFPFLGESRILRLPPQ